MAQGDLTAYTVPAAVLPGAYIPLWAGPVLLLSAGNKNAAYSRPFCMIDLSADKLLQWQVGYFITPEVKMSLNLADYSDKLATLCVTYGVKRLELFGSATRNDFNREKSDLDFLVEFTDPYLRGAFDRYFGLKEELEQLFQRPVDLVEVKAIKNPYFRQAIDQDKVLVYGT